MVDNPATIVMIRLEICLLLSGRSVGTGKNDPSSCWFYSNREVSNQPFTPDTCDSYILYAVIAVNVSTICPVRSVDDGFCNIISMTNRAYMFGQIHCHGPRNGAADGILYAFNIHKRYNKK